MDPEELSPVPGVETSELPPPLKSSSSDEPLTSDQSAPVGDPSPCPEDESSRRVSFDGDVTPGQLHRARPVVRVRGTSQVARRKPPDPSAPRSSSEAAAPSGRRTSGAESEPGSELGHNDSMDTLLDEEDARIEVVYQFNSNPKKNIAALCAYFKQDPTPPNIARLLRTTEGLLGDKIGDYLVRPENTEVLRAYFDDLDFKVDFVEAMRRGLSGPFFMPGEAQQVERTMQALCDAYMAQNPTRFGHPDDPVVLGYALVMLNTDMLKPNVKTKMTVAEFIDNTSRALEHSVFTPEELTALYNSLKATPFAFAPATNEFMAMSAPKISGYLRKKSVRFGAAWSTHFFVLANSCLYYFQDNAPENKDKILGMIQLVEVEISADHESPKRLKVTAKGEEIQYVKLGRGKPTLVPGVKVLLLEAQDEETRNKWLSRLKKSAIMLAFQDGSAGGSVEITSESANETV